MSYRKPAFLAILCSLLILAGIIGSAVVADNALASGAHAVSLKNAEIPPTEMVYLGAGAYVSYPSSPPICHGKPFSEQSAYTWTGGKLGAQHRVEHGPFIYDEWTAPTGRVIYDGVTFRNQSHRPVLVALWCE